ncbi:MAG: ABC transporter permease [Candidatus Hydrogenedentes bacterium]|nr:ABC transporter permease [Candidatus Hydrogenedentota bacterium]
MNFQRTWAIARKEFLHVVRDPRSLGMAIAMPMLMLLLFGYALTLDVDRVPLVVWDQSGTKASREFLSHFTGSRYFSLRGYVDTYADIERIIDNREALLAMVIPRDFSEQIEAGKRVPVQLIADGSDSNTATIAMGYAKAITEAYNQQVMLHQIQRFGITPPRQPLDVRARVWYNADLESRNFIVPGLIAVIMSIIGAMLTSLTIAREWERGTMEQLISTPVRSPELLFGKLIPYFGVGMCDVVLAMLMGRFLYHVPLRGSVVLLFATAMIFLTVAATQGMIFSILAKNQLLASQLALMGTFLPAFLLSGFAFAISNMPIALQYVTYIVPARYFVVILKGIYLKGVGVSLLWGDIALLIVFATLLLIVANVAFRKKLT